MIEFEDRLRTELRGLAAELPPTAHVSPERVTARINHRHTQARRQRMAGVGVIAVFLLVGVALAVGGGGGDGSTAVELATPRSGEPGWATIAEPPIEARFQHAGIDLDGEVLVFGGYDTQDREAGGAALYDPVTGRWRQVAEPPGDMHNPTTVWTGSVVLVLDLDGRLFAYDPAADTWTERARSPLEHGTSGSTSAVWTGQEMLVTQGSDHLPAPPVLTYNPDTDRWTGHGPAAIPGGAGQAWTGNELLMIGSDKVGSELTDDQVWSYSLTDGWEQLPPPPLELWPHRMATYAVWTGTEYVVGGGSGWTDEAVALWDQIVAEDRDPTPAERQVLDLRPLRDVAAWNPTTRTWRTLPDAPAMTATTGPRVHGDIWTGSEVLTWIAQDVPGTGDRMTGGVALLNPSTGAWRTIAPPPSGFHQQAPATWTGHEVIVSSGEPTSGDTETRGCCDPSNLAVSLTP